MRLHGLLLVLLVSSAGCSSPTQPAEGGTDASADSPVTDSGVDVATDTGIDAPPVCPCTSAQFCKGMTCFDAVFANVCTDSNATVILDSQMTDDAVGHVFGDALK